MNLKNIINEDGYAIISTNDGYNANNKDRYFFIPGEEQTVFADDFSHICIERITVNSSLGEGWLFDKKGIDIVLKMFREQQVSYIELIIKSGYKSSPL